MVFALLLCSLLAAGSGLAMASVECGAERALLTCLAPPMLGLLAGRFMGRRSAWSGSPRDRPSSDELGLVLLMTALLAAAMSVAPPEGVHQAWPDWRPWAWLGGLLATAGLVRALRVGGEPGGIWVAWTLMAVGPLSTQALERHLMGPPVVLLGGLWALAHAVGWRRPDALRRAGPILALGGATGLACLLSPAPGPALRALAPLTVGLFLALALVLESHRIGVLRSTLRAVLALNLMVVVLAVVKWIMLANHLGLRLTRGQKLWLCWNHPNALASLLLLSLPFLLALRSSPIEMPQIRRLATVLVLLDGALLIMTQSRGAWIAALFGAVAITVGIRHRGMARLPRLEAAVAGLVLLLALTGLLTAGAYGRRLLSPESVLQRQPLWELALQAIQSHPVIGIGPGDPARILIHAGGAQLGSTEWLRQWAGWDRLGRHIHNLPLQITLEGGGLCLAALLWLLVSVSRAGWRSLIQREATPLRAWAALSVGALMLHGLVDHTLGYPMVAGLWGIAVGLALGAELPDEATVPRSRPAVRTLLVFMVGVVALGIVGRGMEWRAAWLEESSDLLRAGRAARQAAWFAPFSPGPVRLQARAARSQGQWARAAELQRQTVIRSGEDPDDLLELAGDLLATGDRLSAGAAVQEAWRVDPLGLRTNGRSLMAAAAIAPLTAEPEDGSRAVTMLLLTQPSSPHGLSWDQSWWFDRASVLERLFGPERSAGLVDIPAGPSLEALLERLESGLQGGVTPDGADPRRVRIMLARCYWALQELDRAGRILAQGNLKLDAMDSLDEHRVGDLPRHRALEEQRTGHRLLQEGRHDEALSRLQKARELGLDSDELRVNLAEALAGVDHPREAIRELQAVSARFPARSAIQNNLGVLYHRIGELNRAEARFRAARYLQPEDGEATYNLGTLWLEQDRCGEAIPLFHQVLEIQPDRCEARFNLARCLELQGELGEARLEYRRFLDRSARCPTELVDHARTFLDLETHQ